MQVLAHLLLRLELVLGSPVWGCLNKGKPQAVKHAVLRGLEVPQSPRYLKNCHLAPWWIYLTLATLGSASYFSGSYCWQILLFWPLFCYFLHFSTCRNICGNTEKKKSNFKAVSLSCKGDPINLPSSDAEVLSDDPKWGSSPAGLRCVRSRQAAGQQGSVVSRIHPSKKSFILTYRVPIQVLIWPLPLSQRSMAKAANIQY